MAAGLSASVTQRDVRPAIDAAVLAHDHEVARGGEEHRRRVIQRRAHEGQPPAAAFAGLQHRALRDGQPDAALDADAAAGCPPFDSGYDVFPLYRRPH